MDILRVPKYMDSMRRYASLLVIVFLAVFAASTIVHAVSANAMALDMAMGDGGAMSMADCQGCPEGEDGAPDATTCKLVCTAPAISALNGAASVQHVAPLVRHDRPVGMILPRGLRAPPDPFPPRTLI